MHKVKLRFAFQMVFLSRTKFLFKVLCLIVLYYEQPNIPIYFLCLLKQISIWTWSYCCFCQVLQAPAKFHQLISCKWLLKYHKRRLHSPILLMLITQDFYLGQANKKVSLSKLQPCHLASRSFYYVNMFRLVQGIRLVCFSLSLQDTFLYLLP